MATPVWLDATALDPLSAAHALEAALRGGLDPEAGPARTSSPTPAGELLLMPAAAGAYAGVKVVSVAPGNAARGLPRIHGVYVLFDADTLVPVALVDGADLTTLRTAAVSLVAVTRLTPQRPLRTVLFGTGPQAWGHAEAVTRLRPGSTLTVVGREPARATAFAQRCRQAGVEAVAGTAIDVAEADLIVCATTATTALFDGWLAPPTCCVVAVGSHEPGVREVSAAYVARSAVYVEARSAAGQCGELAGLDPAGQCNLAELMTATVDLDRPRLFKSVGMAWEDLVVAGALHASAPA